MKFSKNRYSSDLTVSKQLKKHRAKLQKIENEADKKECQYFFKFKLNDRRKQKNFRLTSNWENKLATSEGPHVTTIPIEDQSDLGGDMNEEIFQ